MHESQTHLADDHRAPQKEEEIWTMHHCSREPPPTTIVYSQNVWMPLAPETCRKKGDSIYDVHTTELRKRLGTWLQEISSCSCLMFLPGPAWVLLSKIC